MRGAGLAFALACAAIASITQVNAQTRAHVALPIAPGVTGSGPWVIATWSDDGSCENCAGTSEDEAASRSALEAILNGDFNKLGMGDVTPRVLKLRSGQKESTTTLARIGKELSKCEFASQALLRRAPFAGPGTSLGAAFRCPGHNGHLSISVLDQRVTNVYWLPEAPIYLTESK